MQEVKYYCDKCGEEITDKMNYFSVDIGQSHNREDPIHYVGDLCRECAEELIGNHIKDFADWSHSYDERRGS